MKKLKMPLLVLLAAILSTSCAAKLPPLVSLRQLDLSDKKNPIVNSFEITKYNKDTCRLELKAGISTPLYTTAKMNGAICLDVDEYTKFRTYVEAECINERDNKDKK